MSYAEEALAHGVARHRAGHLSEAQSVYESVISLSLDPKISGAALAHLSTLHLKRNRIDAALLAANQALRHNDDNGTALWAWLQCQRRLGMPERALEALKRRPTHGLPPQILHEMALSHEACGHHRKAYLCFKEAKRRISFTDLDVDRNLLLDYIAAIAKTPPLNADSLGPSLEGQNDAPIFLVGFNESGVKELGEMLNKHPGLRLAADLPALVDARRELNDKDPGNLAAVNDDEWRRAQAAYFACVDRTVAGNGRIIDALPMNVLMVNLIRHLFPDSIVVHCVRHPCEAVLETFFRPYALNNVTCHFDRLERTALTYAGVMAAVSRMETEQRIELSTIHYEDLMNHPNEIVGAITAAIGLDCTDFGTIAPRSPTDRWMNYRSQMSRWLPTLLPLAEGWGYPAK